MSPTSRPPAAPQTPLFARKMSQAAPSLTPCEAPLYLQFVLSIVVQALAVLVYGGAR